jgi:predicted RNA-binding protein with PIN domain
MEILYSHAGQTADQMIERAAYRLAAYGEVLVVTNDRAERDIVLGSGGMASSCEEFIQCVHDSIGGLHRDLNRLNRIERNRYHQSR